MPWRRWLRIGKRLVRRERDDQDLNAEIRFHLHEEARLRAERGAPVEEAMREARCAFGSVALAKERTRAVWVPTRLEQCVQDLRFACRIVTRTPGVSAAAVLLVALVIGGNTTLFTVVYGVLKKPAPGVTADRLVRLNWQDDRGFVEPAGSYLMYRELASQSTTLQPLAAFQPYARLTLLHDQGSDAVNGTLVAGNYFDALGVRLARGRTFTEQEAEGDALSVTAVISHRIWQDSFQQEDDIIGRSVVLSGVPVTIVGVAPPAFRGATLAESVGVWVPLVSFARAIGRQSALVDPAENDLAIVGRLADTASIQEANAEIQSLWTGLQATYPEVRHLTPRLVEYSAVSGSGTGIADQADVVLAVLSVLTLLTLLIVCANVANLLIARAVVRQRELAVRQALGASRFRVVRMLLAEGALIASLATVAAFACAWWISRALSGFMAPGPWAAVGEMDFTPDWTVAAYALIMAAVAVLAFTIAPGIRTWRLQVLPWLKAGEQGIVQGRSRLSSSLVVLQLALSVLLLTVAGLAYRSLALAGSADLGFDTRNLLLATLNTSSSAPTPAANAILLESLRQRLETAPGVVHVSYARLPPFRDGGWPDSELHADIAGDPLDADTNHVGPGYLQLLGISPILGRDLGPTDTTTGITSAIVTQSVATELWPDDSVLGRMLQIRRQRTLDGVEMAPRQVQIVGVIPDILFGGVRPHRRGFVLLSAPQEPALPGEMTLYVRYSASIESITATVRGAVREVDPRTSVASVRTLDAQRDAASWPLRALTMLLTLFAGASLLIAAIGQYAVVSFETRRRTREFGLRIALGASPGHVVRAVFHQGFTWTVLGLLFGTALSLAVGRALGAGLYGVTPTDPITFAGVFALLATASLVACYLPARRAAHIYPTEALREE